VIRIDKFGRILIPKSIQYFDGEITLQPAARGEIELRDGVYVWTGYDPIEESLEQLIDDARADRTEMLA
jgi:hypothetical protein